MYKLKDVHKDQREIEKQANAHKRAHTILNARERKRERLIDRSKVNERMAYLF